MQQEVFKAFMAKGDTEKAELLKKLHDEILPRNLKFFEERLKKTNTGYLVGSNATLADIFLISALEKLGDQREAILANYTHLYALDKRIRSHPKVADWIAKRPNTPF